MPHRTRGICRRSPAEPLASLSCWRSVWRLPPRNASTFVRIRNAVAEESGSSRGVAIVDEKNRPGKIDSMARRRYRNVSAWSHHRKAKGYEWRPPQSGPDQRTFSANFRRRGPTDKRQFEVPMRERTISRTTALDPSGADALDVAGMRELQRDCAPCLRFAPHHLPGSLRRSIVQFGSLRRLQHGLPRAFLRFRPLFLRVSSGAHRLRQSLCRSDGR